MRTAFTTRSRAGLLLILGLALPLISAGCTTESADSSQDSAHQSAVDSLDQRVDAEYLTSELWNDGRAEVAFYRVERSRDTYGRANPQSFTVGTYVVKHRFSREEMSKVTDGSGVSAFKYAFFYEVESGSYQHKRNWVVNARQQSLQPLKHSFTSFDWCSNRYRELAFGPERVEMRMRSDDYGNERASFDVPPTAVPVALVPFLVRSLSFEDTQVHRFPLLHSDGSTTRVAARLDGTEKISTPAGTSEAERIRLTMDAPVPSMIAEETAGPELYWRGVGPDRRLLRVSGEGYTMTLIEHLRTAYWQENIWPMLDRVEERP